MTPEEKKAQITEVYRIFDAWLKANKLNQENFDVSIETVKMGYSEKTTVHFFNIMYQGTFTFDATEDRRLQKSDFSFEIDSLDYAKILVDIHGELKGESKKLNWLPGHLLNPQPPAPPAPVEVTTKEKSDKDYYLSDYDMHYDGSD